MLFRSLSDVGPQGELVIRPPPSRTLNISSFMRRQEEGGAFLEYTAALSMSAVGVMHAEAASWPHRLTAATAYDHFSCREAWLTPQQAGALSSKLTRMQVPSATPLNVSFSVFEDLLLLPSSTSKGMGAEEASSYLLSGDTKKQKEQSIPSFCTSVPTPPAITDIPSSPSYDLVAGSSMDIMLLHLLMLWISTSYAIFSLPNSSHDNLRKGGPDAGISNAHKNRWLFWKRKSGHLANILTTAWDVTGFAIACILGMVSKDITGTNRSSVLYCCYSLAWTAAIHVFWNIVGHRTQTLLFEDVNSMMITSSQGQPAPNPNPARVEKIEPIPEGSRREGTGHGLHGAQHQHQHLVQGSNTDIQTVEQILEIEQSRVDIIQVNFQTPPTQGLPQFNTFWNFFFKFGVSTPPLYLYSLLPADLCLPCLLSISCTEQIKQTNKQPPPLNNNASRPHKFKLIQIGRAHV